MSKVVTPEHQADSEQSQISKTTDKLSRSKDLVGILAASLPVVGAVGTLFVWMMANFFVGDVEVLTPASFHSLAVNVYDAKGQMNTFHSPHFQLMPGQYHFEIIVDGKQKQRTDAQITFRQKTSVHLRQSETMNIVTIPLKTKGHWWQFWRKNNASINPADDVDAEAQQ